MALDLRRPSGRCRQWLEATLLSLEARGVLEATAERRPPHYHVALFPDPYVEYVNRMTQTAETAPSTPRIHIVEAGDTLWGIARRHGASPRTIRQTNGLTSSRIYPGQELRISTSP